jgi:hypothetical protein
LSSRCSSSPPSASPSPAARRRCAARRALRRLVASSSSGHSRSARRRRGVRPSMGDVDEQRERLLHGQRDLDAPAVHARHAEQRQARSPPRRRRVRGRRGFGGRARAGTSTHCAACPRRARSPG